ncbi:hypothetical protein GA0061098_1008332, partial [Bradyrhizobium shewense]
NCGEMAGRAYGKTVWSWPSLLRSSPCEGASEPNRADCIIQIRGAREARRNGRLPGDHGISRPAIAQGRPSDRHHLYAAVRFFLRVHFAQRTAGASQHPAFPAPSWMRGANDEAKLGRMKPRGCKAVCAATHALSSPGLTGRSSIPEALVIESRGRGVLDSPPSRGMTVEVGERRCRLILRHCEEPLRRSNPESLRRKTLDCFAALATTP